jgi:pyruvate formate lyase activating enzyme
MDATTISARSAPAGVEPTMACRLPVVDSPSSILNPPSSSTFRLPCAFPPDRSDASRAFAVKEAGRGDCGFVHSIHTGSVVDGPGVRMVLWTTGCLLRCQYCHNPDTWHMKDGRPMALEQVMAEIEKYRRFMQVTRGGVTISGGEPMVQAPFVARILRECKQRGIHTCLDTNGFLTERMSDEDLEAVDLVLLDIKSFDPETHLRVTGQPVEPVLEFAARLAALGKPTWIRFVLVPGLTDDPENVDGLADFVATLPNVERVEVLPFHQMGASKWDRLGVEYPLRGTDPPSRELVDRVIQQFRARGLQAR